MTTPRNSKSASEHHEDMPKFGMRWFQYNPAYHLAATMKMTAEEKAAHYDALNTALIMETRGISPEADRMLDNADRVSKVRRDAASKRWGENANAMQMHSKCNALPTDLPTDLPNRPTKRKKREAAGAATLTQSEIEIPSCEVFGRFGEQQGFDPDRVEKCFRHYEASGWRDIQGQPVRNWKAKLSSWMNRPELETAKARKSGHRAEQAAREFPPNAKPRIV